MKKLLLTSALLLLSLCLKLSAQTTTIQTWYVIPPTSGCNGVWAVQASTASCGGSIATYNMNPPGCVQMSGPTVADTTYWSLCAVPCNLTMINTQGQMCICSTGTVTNVAALSQEHIITTYPNPATSEGGWNVWIDEPGRAVTVNIYNTFGQLVFTQSSASAEQVFHVDALGLPAGTYFTEIMVNGAAPYRQKLIFTQ